MRHIRLPAATILIFLAIEFLDELAGGVGSAAWPLVRNDLNLTYVQIGLLLSVPGIVSSFVEPFIGILGDVGYRRILVIGGGVAFAAALGLVSVSQGFIVLLIGWMVYYPASGAFVSLSQASLMDSAPSRREQNMVRWEFVGWVGYALGPLALMAAIAVGLGWRIAFLSMAAITVPAIIAVSRIPIGPRRNEPDLKAPSFADGVRTAIKALKRFRVIKWLALLQASDLMLAIFSSFLALYMVDVSGVSESKAALTLSVWLGVSLLGNLFLIPLLERMRGLTYLQFSVIAVLALYPAFLLVSSFEMKLIVVGLLGFASAGWYSILQGHAYSSLPGRSGTIVALGNVFGIFASLIPLGLGLVSAVWGLNTAMWLLLAGPVVLLFGLSQGGMRGSRK